MTPLILYLAAFALRAAFNNVREYSRADETIYVIYATRGLRDFPALVRDFAAGRGDTPTPLRFGWIAICGICRATTHRRLAWLSTTFGAMSVPLAYELARGHVSDVAALTAAILVAFSSINLAMSRRALQDSAVGTLTLAVFLCADRGSWWLTAIAFSLLLTVKEVSILAAPAVGALLSLHAHLPQIFAAVTIPVLVFVGLLVWLNDGTANLETLVRKMTTQSAFPYAIQYGRGPLHSYLAEFFLLSPVVAVATVSGWTWDVFTVSIAFYVAAWSVLRFWNYRFFVAGDALLRIIAAGALARWHWSLIFVVGAWECWTFRRVFLQRQTYDPVFYNVVKSMDMVP